MYWVDTDFRFGVHAEGQNQNRFGCFGAVPKTCPESWMKVETAAQEADVVRSSMGAMCGGS